MVLLVRGYASDEVWIWFIMLALLVAILGGRWIGHLISLYIRHRRQQHQWPFR